MARPACKQTYYWESQTWSPCNYLWSALAVECPQAVSVRLRIWHTSRKMNHLCTVLNITIFTRCRIQHSFPVKTHRRESLMNRSCDFWLNFSLFCAVALLLSRSPALSLSYSLAVSLCSLGLKHSLFFFVMQSFSLSDSLYRTTLALSFSFFLYVLDTHLLTRSNSLHLSSLSHSRAFFLFLCLPLSSATRTPTTSQQKNRDY